MRLALSSTLQGSFWMTTLSAFSLVQVDEYSAGIIHVHTLPSIKGVCVWFPSPFHSIWPYSVRGMNGQNRCTHHSIIGLMTGLYPLFQYIIVLNKGKWKVIFLSPPLIQSGRVWERDQGGGEFSTGGVPISPCVLFSCIRTLYIRNKRSPRVSWCSFRNQ